MTENLYNKFAAKFTRSVAYTVEEKNAFHRDGMKLLKSLAKDCGIEADFRSNKGGIAVSGEITMHGDTVYVQLYQPSYGPSDFQFLVRSCQGRKDYTGATNHFVNSSDPCEKLITLINRLK